LFIWRGAGRVFAQGGGLALDRTLAARLPIAALQKAIAERQRRGLGASLDRGVQYACGDYARCCNSMDDPQHESSGESVRQCSCESFLKTFKREEIYANQYAT